MPNASRPPSRLVSVVLLILAAGAAFLALKPSSVGTGSAFSSPETRPPEKGPLTPEAKTPSERVRKALGPEGERLHAQNPAAFDSLAELVRRRPDTLDLLVAWKSSLPDWDRTHRLPSFHERLRDLPEDRLRVARKVPAALSLLLADNLPVTRRVLAGHGARAWRLFLAINHFAYPEHLERLARLVEEDDLALDLDDQLGLAFALMLVPPEGGSRELPSLVRHVWRTMTPAEAAGFLDSYYRVAAELLDAGRTREELTEACDRFRDLPEFTREVCLDHPRTFRLLVEGSPGVEALKRCGPEAAELVCSSFDEPALRRPALVSLAGLGLMGLDVLERFRKYEPFRALLRRADAELLEGPQPLVVDAVARIADAAGDAQQQIDRFLKTPNLARSLAARRVPPRPAEDVLEFMPGYTAFRAAQRWVDGDRVSGGDLTWAALDSTDTVLLVKGLVLKAGKSVATRLARRGVVKGSVKAVGHRPSWEAMEGLKLDGTDTAKRIDELRQRYGESPRNWPSEARDELRLLLARTPGLSAALAAERRELLQQIDLQTALEQAAPVARRVGLALWVPGDGPLARPDRRLPLEQECSGVGDFARSLLESGPYLRPITPGPSRGAPASSVPMKFADTKQPASDSEAGEPSRDPLRTAALLALSAVLGLAAVPPVRGYLGRSWRRPPRPKHQPLRE